MHGREVVAVAEETEAYMSRCSVCYIPQMYACPCPFRLRTGGAMGLRHPLLIAICRVPSFFRFLSLRLLSALLFASRLS